MTPEELRKLDGEIRDIFFEPWDERRCRICGWPLEHRMDEGCVKDSCSQRPVPDRRADEPAHYSTDPLASKALRDKLAENGYSWELYYHFNLFPKSHFQMYNGPELWAAYAETEELAVVLCALKSVGVEY